jgi:hypothetical protein
LTLSTSRRRQLRKRPDCHHGDLAAALVAAAIEIVDESGVAPLTLWATARRVAVSHDGGETCTNGDLILHVEADEAE